MRVLCLNSKRTHNNNPECPQRLVPEPDRDHWYCLDCGLSIIQESVEVTLVRSVGIEDVHVTPSKVSEESSCCTCELKLAGEQIRLREALEDIAGRWEDDTPHSRQHRDDCEVVVCVAKRALKQET